MHASPSRSMGLPSPLHIPRLGGDQAPTLSAARHAFLPVMHDGGVSTLSGPVPSLRQSLCGICLKLK